MRITGRRVEGNQIQFNLNVLSTSVSVTFPKSVAKYYSKYRARFLPDTHESDLVSKRPVMVEVARGPPQLNLSDLHVYLTTESSPRQMAFDAILLMSRILERELNSCGVFSLHAACLVYKGHASLLIGEPGVGKTSSAVSVCLRNKEISCITGNRVLLKEGRVVGGLRHLTFRYDSLKDKSRGKISLGLLGSISLKGAPTDDDRVIIDPASLGLKFELDGNPIVNRIFQLRRSKDEQELFEREITDDEAFLSLYESASWYGDIFPSVLLGPRIPLPEVLPYSAKEERARLVRKLVSQSKITECRGNLELVSESIATALAP